MASNCPHCGTHISIAHAEDTRDKIIDPAPAPQQSDPEQQNGSEQQNDPDQQNDPKQPSNKSPNPPHLDSSDDNLDSNKDDLDLSTRQNRTRLRRLICKCPCYGGTGEFEKHLTFRQYLCVGYLGSAKPGRPWETLYRTTIKMHDAIRCTEALSVDHLFASRLLGLSNWYAPFQTVFQAIGAIVYDMEWTSDDGELEFQNAEALADAKHTISPNFKLGYDECRAVLEQMLLTDYGIPGFPVFQGSKGSSLSGQDSTDSSLSSQDSTDSSLSSQGSMDSSLSSLSSQDSIDSSLSSRQLDALWRFERFSGFLAATAWRWKQGHAIPDQEAWDLIESVLGESGDWSNGYFTWDAAIMCRSNLSGSVAPF